MKKFIVLISKTVPVMAVDENQALERAIPEITRGLKIGKNITVFDVEELNHD